ncbi:hypothetical protein INT45_005562 [Circinella minor]|uniref:Ubiquitin thioesterase OTU n=1 Tax=Circinella minor TaxID=1195481 RepID=A0A8H7SB74_9FUNG|nr:hypothetical protein INT45_005562 [Circinella minor]
MRIRVRHPNGASILDSLTPEQNIAALKEAIAKEIGITWQQVEVSGGYPPRKYTNDSDTLEVVGIRNGDALNVKVLDTSAGSQQQQQSVSEQMVNTTTTTSTNPLIQPQLQSTQPIESLVSADTSETVETSGGYLSLRTVPDDNSCLFRSIVIATSIKEDPITYSDATLGQSREKYIDWIKRDTSWGGAIEISIFSKHFNIEIASIDIQTGRIDRFGEGSYSERVFIIYSGIHYDALALSPMTDAPADFDQTRFPVTDDSILEAAKKLAEILRQKRKFTDVANFTLKCNQCQKGLVGEKDAQDHAAVCSYFYNIWMATGHVHFVEY